MRVNPTIVELSDGMNWNLECPSMVVHPSLPFDRIEASSAVMLSVLT